MGYTELIIAIVMLIISFTITALTTKRPARPADAPPATLKEFNFPQIIEGQAQMVIFGDVWLTDWEVLWYGNLRSEGIPAPSSGGGGKK